MAERDPTSLQGEKRALAGGVASAEEWASGVSALLEGVRGRWAALGGEVAGEGQQNALAELKDIVCGALDRLELLARDGGINGVTTPGPLTTQAPVVQADKRVGGMEQQGEEEAPDGNPPLRVLDKQEVLVPWARWLQAEGHAPTREKLTERLTSLHEIFIQVVLDEQEYGAGSDLRVMGLEDASGFARKAVEDFDALADAQEGQAFWEAWGLFWDWIGGSKPSKRRRRGATAANGTATTSADAATSTSAKASGGAGATLSAPARPASASRRSPSTPRPGAVTSEPSPKPAKPTPAKRGRPPSTHTHAPKARHPPTAKPATPAAKQGGASAAKPARASAGVTSSPSPPVGAKRSASAMGGPVSTPVKEGRSLSSAQSTPSKARRSTAGRASPVAEDLDDAMGSGGEGVYVRVLAKPLRRDFKAFLAKQGVESTKTCRRLLRRAASLIHKSLGLPSASELSEPSCSTREELGDFTRRALADLEAELPTSGSDASLYRTALAHLLDFVDLHDDAQRLHTQASASPADLRATAGEETPKKAGEKKAEAVAEEGEEGETGLDVCFFGEMTSWVHEHSHGRTDRNSSTRLVEMVDDLVRAVQTSEGLADRSVGAEGLRAMFKSHRAAFESAAARDKSGAFRRALDKLCQYVEASSRPSPISRPSPAKRRW